MNFKKYNILKIKRKMEDNHMTEHQKSLLKKLSNVLFELSEEANNQDFNMELANLGIFSMSIDEAGHEILNKIDSDTTASLRKRLVKR